VLRAHLCPLLIRFLSSPPHHTLSSSTSFAFSFPLTLRLTRVVFLLLKQFSDLLTLESEVFLTMFVRVIAPGDSGGGASGGASGEGVGGHPTGAQGQHSPLWMRVLALEIFRGLCADFALMVKVFRRYDAQALEAGAGAGGARAKGKGKAPGGPGGGSTVFSDMMTALNRLATEKPSALGVGAAVVYGSSLGPVFSSSSASALSHGGAGSSTGAQAGAGGVIDSAMEMGWGVAAGVGSVVGSSVAAAAGAVGASGALGAPQPSLSTATAAMKLQCIDQLDKAEPPHIPDTYLFLLALQCLAALADGFAVFTLSASADVARRYGLSSSTALTATATATAGALDWAALDANADAAHDPQVESLRVVRAMAESTWPAFLASLSFFIATALGDDLFADVVSSLQNFTSVLGALDLETPREAFLTSLCKFAMPPQVVSHLASAHDPHHHHPHHHGHSASQHGSKPSSTAAAVLSAGAESLALLAHAAGAGAALGGSLSSLPVGLSSRNLACLRALIGVAHYLAGSLHASWFCVFETLQNADFVLRAMSAARGTKKRAPAGAAAATAATAGQAGQLGGVASSTASSGGGAAGGAGPGGEAPPVPVLPSEADEVAIQHAIAELFDVSKELEDGAFRSFVGALCRLSGEMIGLSMNEDGTVVQQASAAAGDDHGSDDGGTTTPTALDTPSRRRSSGMSFGRRGGGGPGGGLQEKSFGISKVGTVSLLNAARLIQQPPSVGWDLITGHLLHVVHCTVAPTPIRIQAADVLGQLLVLALKTLASLGKESDIDLAERVQTQVLVALAAQAEPGPRLQTSTDVDIRRMALETLLKILESNGHAFVTGWDRIFHVLRTACPSALVWAAPPSPVPSAGGGAAASRRSLDTISEYDGLGHGGMMTPLRADGAGYFARDSISGGGGGGTTSAASAKGAKTGVLVRTSFPSLQLICTDFLDPLNDDEIRDCIGTLAEFGKQGEDVNVALTVRPSLSPSAARTEILD